MKVKLDPDIYKWLQTINIFKSNYPYKILPTGKFELDEIVSNKF